MLLLVITIMLNDCLNNCRPSDRVVFLDMLLNMWQAGFTYFCLLRFFYYYCTALHCVWSMAAVALQSRAWRPARSLRPYQTPHISYGSCYLGLNTDIFYGHRHSQYFISRTRTFYITRVRIWTRTRTCRTLPCSCTDMDMGYGCLRH